MKTEKPWCLRYFTYDHLPEGKLRECSRMFAEAAHSIDDSAIGDEWPLPYTLDSGVLSDLYDEMVNLPSNYESVAARGKISSASWRFYEGYFDSGMRYLLEAKDCAVRSLLEVSNDETD